MKSKNTFNKSSTHDVWKVFDVMILVTQRKNVLEPHPLSESFVHAIMGSLKVFDKHPLHFYVGVLPSERLSLSSF